MPEPNTNWYFQPRGQRDGAEDDSAAGLISLPAEVLQRHGARILDPETAVAVAGYPTPRSTVYRARRLLVPADLQQEPAIGIINQILRTVGMRLHPATPAAPAQSPDRGSEEILQMLAEVPRPLVLTPAEGSRRPVVVDAWVALQTLRAAAVSPPEPTLADVDRLDREDVDRISLEHLLVGSAITGSPAHSGGGGLTANPDSGSGPASTDSYLFSGGDTRTPVAVLLDPPARTGLTAGTPSFLDIYGRRPVLAVVDTGIRAQPTLGVAADGAGGYNPDPGNTGDSFIEIDEVIQDAIRLEGETAEWTGDQPRQVIRHAWDTPVSTDPLVGELGPALGHGTFIAGIARQVAPDARVLAIRVMHSDDIVYEGDLLCALTMLGYRIALAEAIDSDQMVDVISLSLGYFSESPADRAYTFALWKAIRVLLELGVVVVAAAGNYSTSRRFYPAAFAQQPPAGHVPVISVGALNPNGSKAVFSDAGGWVTAWSPGGLVVSTFPTDVNGSRTPELRMAAHPANPLPPGVSLPGHREALDPDDYSCGWAVWSGTSFSAPLLAAQIIRSLLEGPSDPVSDQVLKPCGPLETTERALTALKNMGWPD